MYQEELVMIPSLLAEIRSTSIPLPKKTTSAHKRKTNAKVVNPDQSLMQMRQMVTVAIIAIAPIAANVFERLFIILPPA